MYIHTHTDTYMYYTCIMVHCACVVQLTLENPSSKPLRYRILLRGDHASKFTVVGGSDTITVSTKHTHTHTHTSHTRTHTHACTHTHTHTHTHTPHTHTFYIQCNMHTSATHTYSVQTLLIQIGGRKSGSIEVEFRGRQIRPCDAVLLLVAESGRGTSGTSVAFHLQGRVTGALPQVQCTITVCELCVYIGFVYRLTSFEYQSIMFVRYCVYMYSSMLHVYTMYINEYTCMSLSLSLPLPSPLPPSLCLSLPLSLPLPPPPPPPSLSMCMYSLEYR